MIVSKPSSRSSNETNPNSVLKAHWLTPWAIRNTHLFHPSSNYPITISYKTRSGARKGGLKKVVCCQHKLPNCEDAGDSKLLLYALCPLYFRVIWLSVMSVRTPSLCNLELLSVSKRCMCEHVLWIGRTLLAPTIMWATFEFQIYPTGR